MPSMYLTRIERTDRAETLGIKLQYVYKTNGCHVDRQLPR